MASVHRLAGVTEGTYMGNDEPEVTRSASVTNLILWLSACLLAAAWGSTIDPSWQPIWLRLGAFGMVSAIGLRVAGKLREKRKIQAERKSIESTINKRVEAIVKREEVFFPVGPCSGAHREAFDYSDPHQTASAP